MPTEPLTLRAEIAQRLRELRTERGLKQTDVSDRMRELGFVKWGRVTVAEIEGERKRAVSVEELFGLSQVFGVSVKSLLGVHMRRAPSSSATNLVRLTSTWAPDRADLLALIDTGPREAAEQAELKAHLARLLAEAAEAEETVRHFGERVLALSREREVVERALQAQEMLDQALRAEQAASAERKGRAR